MVTRYMHGISKADELSGGASMNPNSLEPMSAQVTTAATASAGNRTRRTGLLTVMERPPGNYFLQSIFVIRFLHDYYYH